jgi:hypothetical protein
MAVGHSLCLQRSSEILGLQFAWVLSDANPALQAGSKSTQFVDVDDRASGLSASGGATRAVAEHVSGGGGRGRLQRRLGDACVQANGTLSQPNVWFSVRYATLHHTVSQLPATECIVNWLKIVPFESSRRKRRYGFTCTCSRCRLERLLPLPLTTLLAQISDTTEATLAPELARAYAAHADVVLEGDELRDVVAAAVERVRTIHAQLDAWATRLYEGLQDFKNAVKASQLHHQPQLATQSAASAPDELTEAVAAVGGVDAAVLCVEATVYPFLELLQHQVRAGRLVFAPYLCSTTMWIDMIAIKACFAHSQLYMCKTRTKL